MTAIRISVTAEHIAAGRRDGGASWGEPVARAIAEVAGLPTEGVDLDAAKGEEGWCVATIGTREPATLCVDLPQRVLTWLDRFDLGSPVEPFEFDIEIDDWLVALVAKAATTDEQAQAVIASEAQA